MQQAVQTKSQMLKKLLWWVFFLSIKKFKYWYFSGGFSVANLA